MEEKTIDLVSKRAAGCLTPIIMIAIGGWVLGWCGKNKPDTPTQAVLPNGKTVPWTSVDTTVATTTPPVDPIQIDMPAPPRGPNLPRASLGKLRGYMANLGLNLEPSKLQDGRPRLFARDQETMTIVEVIEPNGDSFTGGSVTVALVKDMPESFAKNIGVLYVFLRETGWENGSKWIGSVVDDGGKKTVNGTTYEVIVITPGMINLSAKPVAAKK